jgi:hypothetical protein
VGWKRFFIVVMTDWESIMAPKGTSPKGGRKRNAKIAEI